MQKAQWADEEPFEVPDGEGAFFESIGYKLTGEEVLPPASSPVTPDEAPKGDDDLIGAPENALSKLTIAQLHEYAKENEIDLTGVYVKAEILARVTKEN